MFALENIPNHHNSKDPDESYEPQPTAFSSTTDVMDTESYPSNERKNYSIYTIAAVLSLIIILGLITTLIVFLFKNGGQNRNRMTPTLINGTGFNDSETQGTVTFFVI